MCSCSNRHLKNGKKFKIWHISKCTGRCGCCVCVGLFPGSASRCCSGSRGAAVAAAAAVTQLEKAGTGKGECWAQVVYRSCQNATMPLTQGLPFPCGRAVVIPQLSGHPRPLARGCLSSQGLWVGCSICFSREAELFFSVTLLPGPELAVEVL